MLFEELQKEIDALREEYLENIDKINRLMDRNADIKKLFDKPLSDERQVLSVELISEIFDGRSHGLTLKELHEALILRGFTTKLGSGQVYLSRHRDNSVHVKPYWFAK